MSRGVPGLTPEQAKRVFRVAWILLGVLVVLLLAGLFWMLGAEQRAINAMEPGKRAAVFQQSFESFESLCSENPGGALAADCQRQARFLQKFPECGGDCRARLSPYLPRWTR